MLDSFLKLFLFLDNTPWYLFLSVLGLLYPRHRQVTYWGLIGGLLCILCNQSLKAYFQVPLYPHLGHGYAFPSGHLQLASFVYIWMANYKLLAMDKLYFILIPLFAYASVHFHFHSVADVTAGIFCGATYFLIYKNIYQLAIKPRLLVISSAYLFCIGYLYMLPHVHQDIKIVIILLPILILISPWLPVKRT